MSSARIRIMAVLGVGMMLPVLGAPATAGKEPVHAGAVIGSVDGLPSPFPGAAASTPLEAGRQPAMQEEGGYWQLVDTIVDPVAEESVRKEDIRGGELCSLETNALSEGSLVHHKEWYQGESFFPCEHNKDSHFSATATWKRPPERLSPDDEIPLEAIVTVTADDPGHWGSSLVLGVTTDIPRPRCGTLTAGAVSICSMTVSSSRPDTEQKCEETLKVPLGHSTGEQFALRYCIGSGGFRYVYEWVGAGSGDPQPPETRPLCREAREFFGDVTPSLPRFGLQVGYDDLLTQMNRAVDDWEKQGAKVFVSEGGEPILAGLWLFSDGDPLDSIDLPERFSFSPNPRTPEGKAALSRIGPGLAGALSRLNRGEPVDSSFAPAGSEAALALSIATTSSAEGRKLNPGEVLQLALNSTGGDLRKATLLAHNTVKSLGRGNLTDVTGITKETGFFDDYLAPIRETDNSGVWYHLFGTMYYQLEVQNGVSLESKAVSVLSAGAATSAYVPTTLARMFARSYIAVGDFAGASPEWLAWMETQAAKIDRTQAMLGAIMSGAVSIDDTGWSGFANAAEQAYREIAGGRAPDPEKFCVNVWGTRLAQDLWLRAQGPPRLILNSSIAGDTMWIGGEQPPWIESPDSPPSDPYDLMLPKLSFSGSPVDVLLEAEGVRLYFDQQAALMLADGEFPYPVQPYFADDGYLGLMWLAPPAGPEPAVRFYGVANGDLHYAVIDPGAGEISTWSAPVREGEELQWSPVAAPTGAGAGNRPMLITGDGREVAPQVVTLSFDDQGNLAAPGGFPVAWLLIGAAAVGAGLIGIAARRPRGLRPAPASGGDEPSFPPLPPPNE